VPTLLIGDHCTLFPAAQSAKDAVQAINSYERSLDRKGGVPDDHLFRLDD
jgi:hypothetical protein